MNPEAPLEQLARRSLDPEVALANGRPTVFEFYASWCEACKEMAPTMLELEKQNEKKITYAYKIHSEDRKINFKVGF